ncbi:hypothetical protein SORBI_3003G215350 [Sorghum bicolor]|uniref:Uncharacterized protein n=1 Tax=Sorghum bicolor TaxID=4558 RepID=A0A1W0VYE2_SORBI|nr:hypothetical protein SORBI_3003G215350 [Sorghum bicolor]
MPLTSCRIGIACFWLRRKCSALAMSSSLLVMELRTVGSPLEPTRTSASALRCSNRTSIEHVHTHRWMRSLTLSRKRSLSSSATHTRRSRSARRSRGPRPSTSTTSPPPWPWPSPSPPSGRMALRTRSQVGSLSIAAHRSASSSSSSSSPLREEERENVASVARHHAEGPDDLDPKLSRRKLATLWSSAAASIPAVAVALRTPARPLEDSAPPPEESGRRTPSAAASIPGGATTPSCWGEWRGGFVSTKQGQREEGEWQPGSYYLFSYTLYISIFTSMLIGIAVH